MANKKKGISRTKITIEPDKEKNKKIKGLSRKKIKITIGDKKKKK